MGNLIPDVMTGVAEMITALMGTSPELLGKAVRRMPAVLHHPR